VDLNPITTRNRPHCRATFVFTAIINPLDIFELNRYEIKLPVFPLSLNIRHCRCFQLTCTRRILGAAKTSRHPQTPSFPRANADRPAMLLYRVVRHRNLDWLTARSSRTRSCCLKPRPCCQNGDKPTDVRIAPSWPGRLLLTCLLGRYLLLSSPPNPQAHLLRTLPY